MILQKGWSSFINSSTLSLYVGGWVGGSMKRNQKEAQYTVLGQFNKGFEMVKAWFLWH